MPRRRVYEEEVNRLVKQAGEIRDVLKGAEPGEQQANAIVYTLEWLDALIMNAEKDAVIRSVFDGHKRKRPSQTG